MEPIGVDAALRLMLARVTPLPAVELPLLDAGGLVLAEPVTATSDIPPFRNSAMDGYAVRAADVAAAAASRPVTLAVVAEVAAGHPCAAILGAGEAARIMTGAPLPTGADAVVRFEQTGERADAGPTHGSVRVYQAVRAGDNVREAGEDVRAGTALLPAGAVLRAAEIGVLASLGHGRVRVHRRPRVAIIATGDEVVGIEATPGPGQIRDSNSYALAAGVRRHGGEPDLIGIAADELAAIRRLLARTRPYDLVISSAGVSIGDYDIVKTALQAEGEIDLWQVNMKPGKALAFGRLGGRPYLGLPGNPVAALISFELFGRPLLLRLLGRRDLAPVTLRVRTLDELPNGGRRRHFVRVRVTLEPSGDYAARMVGNQGSGVLTSMIAANGLAVVPEGMAAIPAGDTVEVILLDRE